MPSLYSQSSVHARHLSRLSPLPATSATISRFRHHPFGPRGVITHRVPVVRRLEPHTGCAGAPPSCSRHNGRAAYCARTLVFENSICDAASSIVRAWLGWLDPCLCAIFLEKTWCTMGSGVEAWPPEYASCFFSFLNACPLHSVSLSRPLGGGAGCGPRSSRLSRCSMRADPPRKLVWKSTRHCSLPPFGCATSSDK